MSFFFRTVVGLAIVAGTVRIFRKDIARIVETLRGPAQTFVKDVRRELEVGATKTLAGSEPAAVAKASDAQLGAAAAETAKEKLSAPTQPPELK